jgi:hypothetical protein
MKLSFRLRSVGYILCCSGFAYLYLNMYLLRHNIQLGSFLFWVETIVTLLAVNYGAGLLNRAARLSKEGK